MHHLDSLPHHPSAPARMACRLLQGMHLIATAMLSGLILSGPASARASAAPPPTPSTPSPTPANPGPAPSTPDTDQPLPDHAPSLPDRADPAGPVVLAPLPARGSVPPIVARDPVLEKELSARAQQRGYERQLRIIRNQHFRSTKLESRRAEGIQKLREFVDPAAFRLMYTVLKGEQDDVRLALLDHLAAQGQSGNAQGYAALAWIAIHADDAAMRHEATLRIPVPAGPGVLAELDHSLRSPFHQEANCAGALAGALGAVQAIPLLIFAQATSDPNPGGRVGQGDLAWIAVQTSTVYVANLEPVVGDGAAGFQPVLGIVRDGVLMRVHDAVVVNYRTDIHAALVNLADSLQQELSPYRRSVAARSGGAAGPAFSGGMEQSTSRFGYDMRMWWMWYNDVLVPAWNTRAEAQARSASPPV